MNMASSPGRAVRASPRDMERAPIGASMSMQHSVDETPSSCACKLRTLTGKAAHSISNASRLERLCLINQHDGDAVSDFVPQTAVLTDEFMWRLPILEFTLALRANQNVQELLVEHSGPSLGLACFRRRRISQEL